MNGMTGRVQSIQIADQVGKEYALPDIDAQRDILDFAALLGTEFHERGQ